eukprot:TRINITY_DN2139_c1_g1_i1.p1 TRINITY_DN2139_c1_g1~~TRINITY_DN2139_c1_g1_i1.p1  ORF type:complete len:445 (-),score=107.85 TRINITY_DN2139_c1_g1_i1:80-1378(-)
MNNQQWNTQHNSGAAFPQVPQRGGVPPGPPVPTRPYQPQQHQPAQPAQSSAFQQQQQQQQQQHMPHMPGQQSCSVCGDHPPQLFLVQPDPSSPEVPMCEKCYKDSFACFVCKRPIDGPYAQIPNKGKAHAACAEKHRRAEEEAIPKCDLCRTAFSIGSLKYPHDSKIICENCFRRIFKCAGCGHQVEDEYFNFEIEGKHVKCHPQCKNLLFCEHCSKAFPEYGRFYVATSQGSKYLCQSCAAFVQQQAQAYRPPPTEAPGMKIGSKAFEIQQVHLQRIEPVAPTVAPTIPVALPPPFPIPQAAPGPAPAPYMPPGSFSQGPPSSYAPPQPPVALAPPSFAQPVMPGVQSQGRPVSMIHPPIPKGPKQGSRLSTPIAVPIAPGPPPKQPKFGNGEICKKCYQPIYGEMISAIRAQCFWHVACFGPGPRPTDND